ncbi:MAG: class D sortase [Thermoanaerobaculia bacterium]
MSHKTIAERAAWAIGIVLLLIWTGYWIHGKVGSRSSLAAFEAAKGGLAKNVGPDPETTEARSQPQLAESQVGLRVELRELQTDLPVDYSLWDEGRIEEYEESLGHEFGPPLAILRIPTLDLHVPLLEGTNDLVLNRGVGRIVGTARPGELGNIGIAGHRDGFFRGLKDIAQGDTIELETLTATDIYRIDKITIVTPQDVHVLEHQAVPTLTLVTCYPFYFVGKAPKRYIVSATMIESDSVATSATDAASP